MKFVIASLTVTCLVCGMLEHGFASAVPNDAQMRTEPLKLVLSKIAPLESWDPTISRFGPKICFRLFRPDPQQTKDLLRVIDDFEGLSRWHFVDGCLETGVAYTAAPAEIARLSSSTGRGTAPKQMTTEGVNRDLANLAAQIEQRLGLHDVEPKSFSEAMLTKEGLRQSHGAFQDFQDGGQRIVYLIVNPGSSQVFQATKADIMLHFEPKDDEMTSIFGDLLGTNLFVRDFQAMTEAEAVQLQKAFPEFWSIPDYHEGGYLTPEKASLLYQECLKISQIVFSPKAIRGIDKLTRIAYWASTKHYGIFFDEL